MKLPRKKLAQEHARLCSAWRWFVEVLGHSEAARMKNSVVPQPGLLPYRVVNSTPIPKGVG